MFAFQKRSKLAKEYERLKAQWLSISEDQESRFFSYSKRKGLVGVSLQLLDYYSYGEAFESSSTDLKLSL